MKYICGENELKTLGKKIADRIKIINPQMILLPLWNGMHIMTYVSKFLERKYPILGVPITRGEFNFNIPLPTYKTIIVLDDIYDTGETYKKLTKIVNFTHYLVMYSKLLSPPKNVEYFAYVPGQWIVFPWE